MNQVDRTVSEKVIKLFYDFKLVIINSVLFQRSKWDHLKNCSRFKPHLNIDLDNQSIRHIHFQSHSVLLLPFYSNFFNLGHILSLASKPIEIGLQLK